MLRFGGGSVLNRQASRDQHASTSTFSWLTHSVLRTLDHAVAAQFRRTLDAELAEAIDRLQRVRMELSLILRHVSSTNLPPELAVAAANAKLSGADRSFITVMNREPGTQPVGAGGIPTHAPQRQQRGPRSQ